MSADLFPLDLEEFGYQFNCDGQLRSIKTSENFMFEERLGDRRYNQQRYEALGEAVTREIYRRLEEDCHLKRQDVPLDAERSEPVSFFFHSADISQNLKLILIIHGCGEVRAGQWSRKLILNNSLEVGSQIPYIKRAVADGYAVVVLNTNLNSFIDLNGRKYPIRNSSCPSEHGVYVWEHFISGTAAKHIGIVAHSAGGSVVMQLAQKFQEDFVRRVFAINLTDSPIRIPSGVGGKLRRYLIQITVNWRCSQRPVGETLPFNGDIPAVSAGTFVHEESSWTAFDGVFDHLENMYRASEKPLCLPTCIL